MPAAESGAHQAAMEWYPHGRLHGAALEDGQRHGAVAHHGALQAAGPAHVHLQTGAGRGRVAAPLGARGQAGLALELQLQHVLFLLPRPSILESRGDLADGQHKDHAPEHAHEGQHQRALPGLRLVLRAGKAVLHADHAGADPPEGRGHGLEAGAAVVAVELVDHGAREQRGHDDVEHQHEDGLRAPPEGVAQHEERAAELPELHQPEESQEPQRAEETQRHGCPAKQQREPEGGDGGRVHDVHGHGDEEPDALEHGRLHGHGGVRVLGVEDHVVEQPVVVVDGVAAERGADEPREVVKGEDEGEHIHHGIAVPAPETMVAELWVGLQNDQSDVADDRHQQDRGPGHA
mmetsp:Transcript_115306/g.350734  ORF Transcript_115306/g.350734 Transcript_115306/m.350734 type:complete len:348 (+) Transcript_115306:508-1551(+)